MATQSLEIKELILKWYERIALGDMVSAAEDMLTHEDIFLAIGTDAAEWFRSRTDLIEAYRATARLGPPEIIVQGIEAYQEGTLAWAADTVLVRMPGKGELSMRHTFILHQEGGNWRVVHAHYSFPSAF